MMRTSTPDRDVGRRRGEEDEEAFKGSFSKKTPPKKTAVSDRWDHYTFKPVLAPPEPFADVPLKPDDGRTIRLVIEAVRAEAEKPTPELGRVDKEASKLRAVASRLGHWLKQRFNKGADAFATTMGVGLATTLLAHFTGLYDALVGAYQAIVTWIEFLGGLL